MNSPQRAQGLDGLRGLAASAVVLLHVWMFSGAHQPEQARLTDQIVGSMGLAVMMFFVLSGYLLATPWVRAAASGGPAPALGRYAVKRAARLLPAYWLCLAGSFVLMQQIEHPLAIDAGQLPLFALFLQNQSLATAGQLNPPLWSLGVEVTFYVAVPIIGLGLIAAIRRFGQQGAIVVAMVMTTLGLTWTAVVYGSGEDPRLLTALPTYLPIFACGILAAALMHGRTLRRTTRTAMLLGGAALVVADGWWHVDSTGTVGHVVRDLPAAAGFALVASAVAKGPAWLLGSAPLRRLGDYSYGIYLWHMPVIYWVRHTDRWPESPWAAFALVLAGATLLGALSWHLVERHAITWSTKRLRRTPPPTATASAPSSAAAANAPATQATTPAPATAPTGAASPPNHARRPAVQPHHPAEARR